MQVWEHNIVQPTTDTVNTTSTSSSLYIYTYNECRTSTRFLSLSRSVTLVTHCHFSSVSMSMSRLRNPEADKQTIFVCFLLMPHSGLWTDVQTYRQTVGNKERAKEVGRLFKVSYTRQTDMVDIDDIRFKWNRLILKRLYAEKTLNICVNTVLSFTTDGY